MKDKAKQVIVSRTAKILKVPKKNFMGDKISIELEDSKEQEIL